MNNTANQSQCIFGVYTIGKYEIFSIKICLTDYLVFSHSNGNKSHLNSILSFLQFYDCIQPLKPSIIASRIRPNNRYCPSGSWYAIPCPMGTYSNVSGAVNNYDCFDCDPGYYCSSVAGGQPTGLCWGGYWCEGASPTPRQFVAWPGNGDKSSSFV